MSAAIYVFDAYGTLFDVHAAVRRHMDAIGPDAQHFSDIWRQKQLEYSWIRALTGKYRDFWILTKDALDTAFAMVPTVDQSLREPLLKAYETLDIYPEVIPTLRTLKERDATLVILSNGSPFMLDAAVQSAGISSLVDAVLSVDSLRTFKAAPEVYDLVTTHFKVFPDAVSFQSANRWDIAGAVAFGFQTVWINRTGAVDEYADLAPNAVLPSLEGLTTL